MSEPAKKVLIIEDHEIVATALAGFITQEFDGMVPNIANTFPDGLDFLRSLRPIHLIILDIQLPGGEGVKMIPLIREIQPGVRILIFSSLEDPRSALSFMSAGANGFASKTTNMSELKHAVATVLGGKKYMSEQVRQKVADSFFQNLSPAQVYEDISLSPREREVMDLMLAGKKSKDISSALNLKLTTISTHKSHIFEKMGVDNIVDLINKLNRRN